MSTDNTKSPAMNTANPTEKEKIAPVQGYAAGIPWSLHLEAYDAYCKRYGRQQALIEGGCRGGFGTQELDRFIPGWRDKVSEIGRLKSRVAELESNLRAALAGSAEQSSSTQDAAYLERKIAASKAAGVALHNGKPLHAQSDAKPGEFCDRACQRCDETRAIMKWSSDATKGGAA